MPELIIVCGLMGVGKTTFVKEYAKKFGYEYIDFDFEYHTRIQEYKINPIEDIPKFLKRINILLNHSDNKDKNFIIDNWFKWHKDWWKDKEDNTLQELKKLLLFHEIRIIYIFNLFEETFKRYVEKHKRTGTMIQENYKETVEERQENLFKKISKWAIQ